ncbi:TonB-dependent receptor plug domain-containing protein [Roseateles violae]|uniref:TonB-dependent receptor n=1 Tax=Roseateles violae TaxID=3058042 RepID=A0ABT8DYY1_9BURK|nr:TonB-dependent receptor [Pelomonas sp. PFR6]MDN3922774.1 TonB-dependent receptor [Pelomonas sp. PFR6]
MSPRSVPAPRPSRLPAPRPLNLALLLALAAPGALWAQISEEAAAKPPARPASATAPEKDGKAQLQRVEVSGQPSDEAVRRASTAAKIVIGREEIERFGDSTLGEVLKRLPGVTTGGRPGRGGDIRMRGMGGGYTQILVDGERMPPGFSLDQLPPDQVERIEILRAPSAEYGARAVAGTINVVLRQALQKKMNDVRLGLSSERGRLQPNFGWTRNDKLDEHGGAYNLTVNAMGMERIDDINTVATTLLPASGRQSTLTTLGQSEESRRGININARLQWRFDGGDTLSIQPFLLAGRGSTGSQFTQQQSNCDAALGDPASSIPCVGFDKAQTNGEGRNTVLRLNVQGMKRLGEDSRVELRGSVGGADSQQHSFRQEYLGGAPVRNQDDTINSRDKSWNLTGKYSRQLENEHSLVGGLEGEGTAREQTRVSLQNGLPRPELADFGDNLEASTSRLAGYLQDEWNVGKQWSFYAGLRGETIATRSTAANYKVSNRSTVWTPLLHGVWKFSEKSRDQIRASLTRSYKSPNLNDLIARPGINPQYPCTPDGGCGPNEPNYPDRTGNPDLRPELATGIDLAYESYLGKGGVLSANVFARHIKDLIRNTTELEDVSWSEVQRWVSRPRNIGTAQTYGIELEAKFRVDEFIAEAWPVNIRSNLSLFHSNVDGIPGPNNKLDQQPRGTANLGFDYRLRSLPLSWGASVNYTPSNEVRQSELQASSTSKKVVTDAFALWSFNPNAQLRLSATNLTPLDYSNGTIVATPDKIISTESSGRTFITWGLRLELKV